MRVPRIDSIPNINYAHSLIPHSNSRCFSACDRRADSCITPSRACQHLMRSTRTVHVCIINDNRYICTIGDGGRVVASTDGVERRGEEAKPPRTRNESESGWNEGGTSGEGKRNEGEGGGRTCERRSSRARICESDRARLALLWLRRCVEWRSQPHVSVCECVEIDRNESVRVS
jgi:hypothetical protein